MPQPDFQAIEADALAVIREWVEALARMSDVERIEALRALISEVEPQTLDLLLDTLIQRLASQPLWLRIFQVLKGKRPGHARPGLPGLSNGLDGTRRNNQRR